MKNPYTWFLLVCITLGLGLSFYLGSQHYDLPVLERFEATSPMDSAQLIVNEIKKRDPTETLPQILFLGITPGAPEDIEFTKAFLDLIQQEEKNKYDVVVVEKNLPMIDQISSQLQLELKDSMQAVGEAVTRATSTEKRLLIIAPNIYTSQMLSSNLVQVVTAQTGLAITSLSVVKFPVTEGQAKEFDPPCQVDAGDVRGTGPLGCAILQKSRILWRNLPASEKYWGRLEKVGPTDYLLLFNRH